MATHDRYDNDILKALQKIANSLDRIMKKLPDNFLVWLWMNLTEIAFLIQMTYYFVILQMIKVSTTLMMLTRKIHPLL